MFTVLVLDDRRRAREFINDYIIDNLSSLEVSEYKERLGELYINRPKFIVRGGLLSEYRDILKHWLRIDIYFIRHMLKMLLGE